MRRPAQGATGAWETLGFVFKWFCLCEFYLILPRDYFGRNDAKAEAPVLWPPHVKS